MTIETVTRVLYIGLIVSVLGCSGPDPDEPCPEDVAFRFVTGDNLCYSDVDYYYGTLYHCELNYHRDSAKFGINGLCA